MKLLDKWGQKYNLKLGRKYQSTETILEMTQMLKLADKGNFKNYYDYVQRFKGKDEHAKRKDNGPQKRNRNYFFKKRNKQM